MTSPAQADLKPLEWIIGKWVSFEAIGRYPTIKDFKFNDTLQFESVRPNVINFREDSKTIDTGNLFYSERGFLTIKPGTDDVALVVAQIIGIVHITYIFFGDIVIRLHLLLSFICSIGTTSVEEGKIENQKITFQSKCIGRSLYFKPSLSNVVKVI